LEKQVGNFIADILLTSSNHDEKLMVEIAVTHNSTVEKQKSGIRIIELSVKDEKDLLIIENRNLSKDISYLNFRNFNVKGDYGNLCSGNCKGLDYDLAYAYKDGRFDLKSNKTLKEINNYLTNYEDSLQTYKVVENYIHTPTLFKTMLSEFSINGFNIRNCFICKYHQEKDYFSPQDIKSIYCKYFRKKCSYNDAVICRHYNVSRNHRNNHISNFKAQWSGLITKEDIKFEALLINKESEIRIKYNCKYNLLKFFLRIRTPDKIIYERYIQQNMIYTIGINIEDYKKIVCSLHRSNDNNYEYSPIDQITFSLDNFS
jgi:hypothetical protein